MKYFLFLLTIFSFLSCSQNDHLSEEDFDTVPTISNTQGTQGVPACSSGHMDYLIPKIKVKSISAPNDSPFFLELENNSESSGTITSYQWTIDDTRNHLTSPNFPPGLCAGNNDCKYTGTAPVTNNQSTFLIPDIATIQSPHGTTNHDDFLVTLTVTDSNGLTASVRLTYASFLITFPPPAPQVLRKLITTPDISLTQNRCKVSIKVSPNDYLDEINSDTDDISLDANLNTNYEISRTLIALPQTLIYDYGSNGTYRSRVVLENDFFDNSVPDAYNLYFAEFALKLQ